MALKLAYPLLLTGCFWVTTKSEGESLRTDVTKLQGQMSSKQAELDTEIAQLKSVLEDATKI